MYQEEKRNIKERKSYFNAKSNVLMIQSTTKRNNFEGNYPNGSSLHLQFVIQPSA